jgi:hypothetical protein
VSVRIKIPVLIKNKTDTVDKAYAFTNHCDTPIAYYRSV